MERIGRGALAKGEDRGLLGPERSNEAEEAWEAGITGSSEEPAATTFSAPTASMLSDLRVVLGRGRGPVFFGMSCTFSFVADGAVLTAAVFSVGAVLLALVFFGAVFVLARGSSNSSSASTSIKTTLGDEEPLALGDGAISMLWVRCCTTQQRQGLTRDGADKLGEVTEDR